MYIVNLLMKKMLFSLYFTLAAVRLNFRHIVWHNIRPNDFKFNGSTIDNNYILFCNNSNLFMWLTSCNNAILS